ncbi:MAG TPA: 50S ribosomal protein L4, partial [Clostridia bacterium]|nr:50S ribosomal protein L4 [Clostridia bacterium]
MKNISVLDMNGKKVSEIELNEAIFGIEPNTSAMHLMVVNYLANQRQGTHSTLTRAEVRGGGRKPWRQKGTGRARQGSIRSPQWYHGGIAFGPKPRSYGFSVNKKVKRLAMKSALSSKFAKEELVVVDNVSLDNIKTKEMVKVFDALNTKKKVLLVLADKDDNVFKSVRNIEGAKTTLVNT